MSLEDPLVYAFLFGFLCASLIFCVILITLPDKRHIENQKTATDKYRQGFLDGKENERKIMLRKDLAEFVLNNKTGNIEFEYGCKNCKQEEKLHGF